MRRRLGFLLPQLVCLVALQLYRPALFAQGPDSCRITPDTATMLVGESRPFRMVSDPDAFDSYGGDQLELYAKRPGDFRVTARTDFAVAEATI